MAFGTILGIASLAMTAGSAWASHRSQRSAANDAARNYDESGRAQRRAAEGSARLLEFNAAIARLQAADALERGAVEEERFRMSIRGLIGSQRATIAANNVDVGFGSALDVQADAAYLGELDALQIRTNAAREAWGYNVEAYDYSMRAAMTRSEGAMLEQQGREQGRSARGSVSGLQSFLGAGASLLNQAYGFSRSGAFARGSRPPAYGGGFSGYAG